MGPWRLMDPSLLMVEHATTLIVAAIGIAILATYVAFEMASRIRQSNDPVSVYLWTTAGALVLGSGAWATNFVAASVAAYPFRAAYEPVTMMLSWVAAIVFAAFLIDAIATRELRVAGLLGWSVATGAMSIGVHFVGMQALVVTPKPTHDFGWIAASALCAIAGSALALAAFRRFRDLDGWTRVRRQLVAAAIFGIVLTTTQRLALNATVFAPGTVCLSSDGLDAKVLGVAVAFDSFVFLTLILLITLIERRAVTRARRLDGSLNQAREELHYATFNDPVTGLPNRLVFQDRLRQAAARCDRTGESLAVLYVKLDGFTERHRLGDPLGDDALRIAATGLVDLARASDTVACVGAHHFAVIVEDLTDAEPAIRLADRCATGLRSIDAGAVGIQTASIGITIYPRDGPDTGVLGNALTAASAARSAGGACYRFFEARMNEEVRERTRWLDDLRLAVPRGEMQLHYQPKFQTASGAFSGVEALLRWRHPTEGLVGPTIFIPLAEQFGLINELGGWVIREACRQMKAWCDDDLRIGVAINLSAHQMRRVGLADEITDALSTHRLDPAMLTCEITESSAMDDTTTTLEFFERLQSIGVQLSIDDFGTGYSSLSYLRKLPVRQLKIDRSFITDLDGEGDGLSIVKAIIDLAHALRLEVIAEGVETERQRTLLHRLGCDKLQGFLLAEPMPAEAVAAYALRSPSLLDGGRTATRDGSRRTPAT